MYKVELTPQAEADLVRLSKPIAQRILKKLRWMSENFDYIFPEPLTGQLQGRFKLRVGDFRVIYTVSKTGQNTIFVHFIRHRSEVYKIK